MNGNNGISNSLPILDKKNWIRWRKQMQSLFGFHKTLEVVTNGIHDLVENSTDAQRVANKEAKKKDYKDEFYIQSAMGEEEKIAGYISKVQKFVHIMKGCGETLTDKMIVDKVLHTLTSHFDHVIVAIQEFVNLERPKFEDLVGLLEAHEMMIVERKGVQDSIQALQARTWKKHGGSNKSKGKINKTQSKKFWSNPQKHKCHLANNCWYKKAKNEGANLRRHNSDDYEDMVVMDAVADEHVDTKIWFLNTCCLNHTTGQKIWLADFDEPKKSKVKLADNISLQAERNGDIVIQRSNGEKSMRKNVLHVPGIKCNLLSVGKMVEKGFSVIMKDRLLELFDTQNNLVLKSPMLENMTFKTIINSTYVQWIKIVVDHKNSL
ncbi:uncharacterized protein LOC127131996 [Lathyrus oleraceus]|uniref:uncharacterized protein LOC127131996 n=1 Tax=Pisum sativum TaxID=3888 RepID=UPI0021D02F45|nr:uncharacterized protein LOC127131996 [Pisum sativum]